MGTPRNEYYLTEDDIIATPATPKVTEIDRPDYIGVVSGAQYKLENADGVSEYALVVVGDGDVYMFETAPEDLRYLAKQINGLME